MKKSSTKKTTSTPAPAKKSAPAVRKAPVAVAAPVKKTAAKPVVTTIAARIDVGFGNALYLRGEGPGLSWDKGVLMQCTGEAEWTVKLKESGRPIIFKFLHNDEVWSAGEDYTAAPGASVVLTPLF